MASDTEKPAKNGKFTKGGAPGPGRPRRVARTDSADAPAGEVDLAELRATLDAWSNIVSGLGTSRDKRTGMQFATCPVTDGEARDLWRGDAMAARIIETIPAESLRQGFEFNAGDKELSQEMEALFEDLRLCAHLKRATQFQRAYGGAALWPVINDGQKLSAPLNKNRIAEISHFQVFEPRELTPSAWYGDPMHPKFRQPERYMFSPISVGPMRDSRGRFSGNPEIHESRLVIFQGVQVSNDPSLAINFGWGDSILTRCRQVMADFNLSWGSAAAMLADFSQGVLKIDRLGELIAANKDGEVQRRLQTMDLVKSILRSLVIDKNDDYQRVTTPVSGVAELLDRFCNLLAAAADMPVTLLMGQSPSGMNATGESDIRFFYDRVAAAQEALQPAIERIVYLLLRSIAGPTQGKEPETWSIEFHPLYQESNKERSEARKAQAETDKIYIEAGVASPEEIAVSRFKGDTYSHETVIDFDARKRGEPLADSPAKTDQQLEAEEQERAAMEASLRATTEQTKPTAEKTEADE